MKTMNLQIILDRETDGRWIADIPLVPGVLAYGKTQDLAVKAVFGLLSKVITDRIDNNEPPLPAYKWHKIAKA